jgi:hypothetical protein
MTPRLLLVLALAAAVATNIIANRRPGSQLRGPLGAIPERSNSRGAAASRHRGPSRTGRLLRRIRMASRWCIRRPRRPCEGSNRF